MEAERSGMQADAHIEAKKTCAAKAQPLTKKNVTADAEMTGINADFDNR
jgi:hypothetical protein